jgi:GNAT superfamily N-acetyltransferase
MDPWTLELVVVSKADMTGGERRAISRDTERGRFRRLRQGVFVDRAAWDTAQGWDGARERHIVEMRALDAVAPWRPVFSHWSACVLHRLPIHGAHLDRVHTTVADERQRGIAGVAAHLFATRPAEVATVGSLLVTTPARTVIDVAGASSLSGGVMTADAALHRGVPRALLEAAIDLAGPRKSARRIRDAVGFAHPGAESPAESETRVSQFRLGIAPQELQHEVWHHGRLVARVDTWDETRRIACEADGDEKYLSTAMAPEGAGRAVIKEKRREDTLRLEVAGLARFGYAEASNPPLLRPILRRVGLLPEQHRPTIADYAAVARAADGRRTLLSR